MKNKFELWIFGAMSLIGLILFVLFVGDVINIENRFKTLSLVISMFLLSGGWCGLISRYIRRKKPKFYDKMLVEKSDERNAAIKNKAGRKAGEITSYITLAVCLIFSSFAKILPFWVIICQACLTMSYPILNTILFSKYYKE